MDDQEVLLKLGFLVGLGIIISGILLSLLEGLLLVENGVFEVGLGKCGVDLVNF